MIEHGRGKLILNAIPIPEATEEITAYLAECFKNISQEKITDIIKKVPVVLNKNLSEKAGTTIASNLEKLGAAASFIPEETEISPPTLETEPIPPGASHLPKAAITDEESLISSKPYQQKLAWKGKFIEKVLEVNKELWLILSMLVIIGLMNYLMTAHRMLMGFYTLPTLFSAYFFGRRHAVLTAFASIFLVGLAVYLNPSLFNTPETFAVVDGRWYDITSWGGILVITAYAMGTLYERQATHMRELQKTYRGILVILRHFISKDQYTENHCYRVSIYASKIATYLGIDPERVEDIRSAALLHDIGKLDISRELLYKAAQLTHDEFEGMKRHVEMGTEMLDSIGGPLGRIIPIILAHHDKYDGSGYHPTLGENIPLEARILSVADVYDALASDRPYRKAMSPFEAKEVIVTGSGKDFDPKVVNAFLKAFKKGEMEVPNLVV